MGVRHFLVPLFALCSLIIPFTAHKVAAQVPYGSCFASRSTWFADNQHGACMYGPSLGATGNGNYLIAASSMLVFDNSADCGACYQITGPNGTSVIVTVVDQCTDGGVCNTSFPHLDLSPQAFDTLADPNVAGVVNTNVQRVACPVQGGIKLRVGSNFFSPTSWEVLIFNHRLPITQVTVLSAGQTTPVSLPRQTYNYWRYDGPAITYPVVITVTDILGNVASFNPTTFSSGLITESTQQFSEPYPYPGSSEEGCPAPPPVAVSTGGWIYQNGLTKEYTDTDVSYINTFQWTDWSYGTTVNWASTTNPFPGSTTCAQAALVSPGAIQIGQVTSFPWAPYFVALQFAIRADSAYSGISVGWKGSSLVPVSVTTSWQLITLSLGPQLQTPTQIGGQVSLLFQNMLGQTSPNIYLDNIRLIPIAGSSSSSSSSTAVSSSSSSVATTSTTSTTSSSSSSSVASSSSSSSSASTATTSSTSSSSSSSSASSSSSSVSSSSSSSSTSSSSSSSISTTSSSPSSGGSSGVVPSNPLPSPQCSISITQAITGSWSDFTTQYTQWSVSVVNTSPQTITEIGLVPQNSQASEIVQFWCVNLVQGTYSFPSWESALSSGSTFTWGYISIGSEPVSFTVVNTVCS